MYSSSIHHTFPTLGSVARHWTDGLPLYTLVRIQRWTPSGHTAERSANVSFATDVYNRIPADTTGGRLSPAYDVVVVGAGNAALCAALSARESGANVLVLERAPEAERGGNTAFTAGLMRVVYSGLDDILELIPDLTDHERA